MNILKIIQLISMLVSLIKLVLQLTERVNKGIADYKEMEIIRKKKKEIDKLIDEGALDELNKLYKL